MDDIEDLVKKWKKEDMLKPSKARDSVSPAHYRAGAYELMDIIEAFGLHHYGHREQAIQYLFRAHVKGNELNDLKKARWYIDREIGLIQEVWDHGRDSE